MTEQQIIDLGVLIGLMILLVIGFYLGKTSQRLDDEQRMVQRTLLEPFSHVRVQQTNSQCPTCGQDPWEYTDAGSDINFEGDTELTQDVACGHCGAECLDVYTLQMRMLRPRV